MPPPTPPEPPSDTPPPRVRVVLLTGPSGSGKTSLAARTGLPLVGLDDFYRDGDDPRLPRGPDGCVDWDDPRAWDRERAFTALLELARTGRADLPVYDLAHDRTIAVRHLDVGDAPLVIAEGIFAAELIGPCRDAGILADAICLRLHPLRTFWRRLARDLREGRKPPRQLLRRGVRLLRDEPRIVARHRDQGARTVGGRAAAAHLRSVARAATDSADVAA